MSAQHTPASGAAFVSAVDAKIIRERRHEKAAPDMFAALRPFAAAAAQFEGCPDTDRVLRFEDGTSLTVGNLRKAYAAIAKATGSAT